MSPTGCQRRDLQLRGTEQETDVPKTDVPTSAALAWPRWPRWVIAGWQDLPGCRAATR